MKKINLISAAVLCILAASCAKEIAGPESIRTVISASIESTKTALGEKDGTSWPNYWKAGDQISVNGVTSEALGADADGKSQASFGFSEMISTPYCAAYPADAVSSYSNGSATLTVPAVQAYVAGSYDPAAFVMYGKSESEASVSLSPLVSVIHLSLTGSASISSIKIYGDNGAALSGSFTTDFSTCTAATVSNEVELQPETPVALPAEFFICVPAGLSGGLEVDIFDANGGALVKTANIKTPLAAGQMYSAPALAYAIEGGFMITAEGITSSTAVICVDGLPDDAYTFNVYSDSECSTLVDSYSVDAGNTCWSNKAPRFCISGLAPGTTYFVKVSDDTNSTLSNLLPVTTEEFTVVVVDENAPGQPGSVILAEDFSELRWDCDMIGSGAGWFPTAEAQAVSFGTVEVGSFQAAETSSEKQLSSQAEPLASSRLAHWAQGANPNMYIHPGYIKLVGSSKVTHIVTPALDNIPDGMLATIEVEVTASAYYSESSGSFCTKNAIVAVQAPGEINELVGESKTNTLDLSTNIAPITLSEETAWNTYKVTLSGVTKGARLAFGAAKDVTKNDARMNLSDIKVTIKSMTEDVSLMLINSDSSFQGFVAAVAAGNTALDARVTVSGSTLNLSSSTVSAFESIEDYEGIFDGNGKTISGLTKPLFATLSGTVQDLTLNSNIEATDESDVEWGMLAKCLGDGASVQNCTSKGSITYTPASAMSSDLKLGGLIGNNRGGSISGCTNMADVSMGSNGQSNGSQTSIGGVVGRTQKGSSSQGSITDCTNSGTVSCFAALSENLYIGGVVGYQVEKAEFMSGCTNSGLVKVGSTFSTAKALQIGGVIGMGKGSIEFCSNLADGVVTTEEGSSAGTYLCQGGVVGRLNRDKDSYAGLSNAGTVNVAAAGGSELRLIGGVVGRCDEGTAITEFTNSGSIDYTATDPGKTYIGGIVASNVVDGITLDDCNSTGGTISYTGATAAGNLYIGGVVGYSLKSISNCTSAMTLNIGGEYARTSNNFNGIGGIVGSMSADAPILDCLNTGDINFSQQLTEAGYIFVGGIAGRTLGSIIDSSNGGTVTITGKSGAQNPYYGGVVGSTDDDHEHSITGKYSTAVATNYGAVVIDTEVQSNKFIYVGGVAGRLHSNGTINATNAGTITVSKLTCTQLLLGGVVGSAKGPVEAGSANLAAGDIAVTGLTSNQQSYIGGVVGNAEGAVTADNAGDVMVTDGSLAKYSLYVGGVAGNAAGALDSCSNSGDVFNAASVTTDKKYFLQVGGVVGYNNANAPLSDCVNSGNVSNAGNSTAYVCVGGITSESDADITNCINNGAVSNSGNSANSKPVCVGGIAGVISGVTVQDSYNLGAISNTGVGSGTSPVGACVGGLFGRIYRNEEDNQAAATLCGSSSQYCYNAGPVSDTSKSTYVAIGGVVGLNDGNETDMSYVQNLETGIITYSGNTRYNSYVGGVLGCANATMSIDYASNAGDLVFRELIISHQMWIGGVFGGFNTGNADVKSASLTMTGLMNSGDIDCPNAQDSAGNNGGNMAAASEKVWSFSYIGGICGVGDCGAKEFIDCTCSGSITVYNQFKVRLGGIAGFLSNNPTGCAYDGGTIIYYRFNPLNIKNSDGTTNTGVVGGIVGYMDIETVHDLTFIGRLQTTGSSPNCYTGGLIGQIGSKCKAFNDCKIYAPVNIVGAGSGSFGLTGAGMFASKSSSTAFDFAGCKVKKGTMVQKIPITEENMAEAVIGRNHASEVTNPPALVDEF